jgi:N,N-dimethylformamidase beta subunit-like, C-terminal
VGGDFNWGTSYDWVVADASNWLFAGTGLKNGDRLPGLVGYEYDKVSPVSPIPPGTHVLSSSPVHDIAQNRDDVSNATVYTARNGAQVFNAATIQWSWGLDEYGDHNVVSASAQKITKNILLNFLTVASTPQP